jgi:hypothetical protein
VNSLLAENSANGQSIFMGKYSSVLFFLVVQIGGIKSCLRPSVDIPFARMKPPMARGFRMKRR